MTSRKIVDDIIDEGEEFDGPSKVASTSTSPSPSSSTTTTTTT